MRLLGRNRRSRGERGAVAVEAALVVPLLAALVFGIIDFSFLLRDYTVVASDTRVGARIAATGPSAGLTSGTCDQADPDAPPCAPTSTPALAQEAADAIQRAGSAMPEDSINYILVYQANDMGFPGANGSTTMPTSCTGVPKCVRFTWRDALNEFRYAGGAWDYKSISACFPGKVGVPAEDLDRVGVYLNASHDPATGFFFDTFTLDDHAVMEFEPKPPATCKATVS